MNDDVPTMKAISFRRTRKLIDPARRRGSCIAGALAFVLCLAQPVHAEGETPASSFSTRFAAVDQAEPSADAMARPPAEPAAPAKDTAKLKDSPKDAGGKTFPPPSASQPALSDARMRYRALIEKEAAGSGLAPEIAEAVMGVESGYNPDVIGGVGEIGLMQLLPSTARMLGFSGSLAELAIPENNIHFGVMYLAQAWRLAGGDLCTAVMKYRAGHGETRFSYLSVNYCVAVRARLFARGFRVTGTVPVATFGEPGRGGGGGGGGCGRKCLGGGGRIGRVDLVALNTRLNALVVQARGGK
ncbi:transglycosylase SLT domain-containing protein [Bradyrhizobium sp. CER78]|uniref:lytic transglycosylase domain-containing protein n=1 Tax=Bradyrhizobium sp. CER78 TaxID=3039162 RepID=UPI00244D0AE0|nr:transglycosylase SLT domain-containing protein [Bradyrhizobium sp. CER78]MDH2385812.1 transglycosylase SLT domain-containing protein [Bradyrhizobium sp. CER78]